MSQISTILTNAQKQIENIKTQEFNSAWAEVKAGELAEYNASVETELADAVKLLNEEATRKKTEKEEALKAQVEDELTERYERLFSTLEQAVNIAKE